METNLLQFSSLVFSNLGELECFAILKKMLLNRGLLHFNSQDQMELFLEVNTRAGRAIHAENTDKEKFR